MKEEQHSRNLHIFGLYRDNHMTMAAIGRRVGLSRERIRQIIRQYEAIFGAYEKVVAAIEPLDV